MGEAVSTQVGISRFAYGPLVLLLSNLSVAGQPVLPLPIIDAHVDAARVPPSTDPRPINCGSKLQEFAPRDGRAKFNVNQVRSYCDRVLTAPATNTENRAAVLNYFRRYDITATVLGSFDELELWQKQFGTKMIPGITLIRPGTPSVENLRAAIISGRVKLLAITTQLEGIPFDAPDLERYFQLAEDLDFPVGVHVGLAAPAAAYVLQPNYLAALSHPLLLEPVLRSHPRLRLYVTCAGWPMGDEMVHLMYSHPQVYVETGIVDWGIPRKEFYRYLQRLVDAGFANRIMFGSDQMLWPDAIPIAIGSIQEAPFLTEKQKRDILYNNAARFFRLERVGSGESGTARAEKH